MSEQLTFLALLADGDAQENAARDRCRTMTQHWFDALPDQHKRIIAQLLSTRQYDTCAALAAAGGDWLASNRNGQVVVLRSA